MNNYYCHDCGRYIKIDELKTEKLCNLCNSSWVERLVKCQNCNKSMLKEELNHNLCKECCSMVAIKFISSFNKNEIGIIYKYLCNNEHLVKDIKYD